MTTHILKPRISGGVWLSGLIALVGIGLIIASLLSPNSATRVAGIILTVIGIVLALTVLAGLRRRRVYVTFDDEGYTVESQRGEYSGSWIDISDVLVSRKNAKIALLLNSGKRTIIAHPARRVDDEFMRVREGIRTHVDESLGAN